MGQCTLIRVNPDFPEVEAPEEKRDYVISIQAKGLETLKAIDAKIKEKLSSEKK